MDEIKIVRSLEKIAFKIRSLALYLELKHYIVRKKSYLMHVYRWNRAIGKSYNLVKLALKYDLPIFVPDDVSMRYLRGIAFENFNHKLKKSKRFKIIKTNDYARGYKFDIALVEEGISEELLNNIVIPSCGYVVGYKAIY